MACLTAGISLCSWVLVYLWCAAAGPAATAGPPATCLYPPAFMQSTDAPAVLHPPPLSCCSMRLLAGSIPFMQGLPANDVAAVCTLAATLAVARSPASAVSP